MFQLMLGVLIFLVGFYCGKVWVTKLAGKTISFSLRTALAGIFIVIIIVAIVVVSINSFRPKKTWSVAPSTYSINTTGNN
ncbi:MAG: hypothetical protein ACE14V_16415 [bacterium]